MDPKRMAIIKCVAIMIFGSVVHYPLLFHQIKRKIKMDYNYISSYLLINILCNDQKNLFLYKTYLYKSLNCKLGPPTLTYFQIIHSSFICFFNL